MGLFYQKKKSSRLIRALAVLLILVTLACLVQTAQAVNTSANFWHFKTVSDVTYQGQGGGQSSAPDFGFALIQSLTTTTSSDFYYKDRTAGSSTWTTYNTTTSGQAFSISIPLGGMPAGGATGGTKASSYGYLCAALAELAKEKGYQFDYALGDICINLGFGATSYLGYMTDTNSCPGSGCSFTPYTAQTGASVAYAAPEFLLYTTPATVYNTGNFMCGIRTSAGAPIISLTTAGITTSLVGALTTTTCNGSTVYYLSGDTAGVVNTGVTILAGPNGFVTDGTSGATTTSRAPGNSAVYRCVMKIINYIRTSGTPTIINPSCLITP